MDISGAALIATFLERHRRSAAIIAGGAPVEAVARALEASRVGWAVETEASALFFDLGSAALRAAGVVAGARARRQALLCFAIQVPRRLIGTPASSPAQTRRALVALTPEWFHVGAAAELVELLPLALQRAEALRTPVLLEVPQDVLAEEVLGVWAPRVAEAAAQRAYA